MSPAIASALTHALFHFLWQGAVVAILLAVALYGFRPRSAQLRYGLACLGMVGMLAAFGATLAHYWPRSHAFFIRPGAAPAEAPNMLTAPIGRPSPKPPSRNWIVPAWLAGVLLFSLRSFGAWIAAARLKRAAFAAAAEWREKLAQLAARARVSRPVTLLESYAVEIPVVIGFLKPAILVPASLFTGFPAEHLEVILLHELAHIRRQDYFVNLLQSVVEDILFYHPAVWWVSSVIRAEREHCCDDAVVAAHGDAHEFAEALASLEQRRWSASEPAVAANGGHLMYRIQRLLNPRYSRPRLTAAPAFSAGLLIAAGAIAVSAGLGQSNAQSSPAPRPAPAPQSAPAPAPQPAAQPEPQATPAPDSTAPQDADSRQADEARLKRELETPYKKWLNEEVFWIITAEERSAFQRLATDEERERFIENFWLKRDPTPGTEENEYREEYYRRIAYATEAFASGVPGWKTDRGMIYIKYGPPNEREEHPSGGTYQRPIEEGGGTTQVYPFEKWRYRYIEGVGNDVVIEFVDPTGKGEYCMTTDPAEKDKLLSPLAEMPPPGKTILKLDPNNERYRRFRDLVGRPFWPQGSQGSPVIDDRLQLK